jgi:hypothetical protein
VETKHINKNQYRLKDAELKHRQKVILSEIKRISLLLNKPTITKSDFALNSKLDFPEHAFIRIFGSFGKAKKQAGLKKSEFSFYEKRDQKKKLFKEIALKHGNTLSNKILMQELNMAPTTIYNQHISPYFGGIFNLCKQIGCDYVAGNKSIRKAFANFKVDESVAEISRNNFSKRVVEIADNFEHTLSQDILRKNSSLAYATVLNYAYQWFGGLEKMCSDLGIKWIKGDHGIDRKELGILKDIREVYKASGNTISQSAYKKKGRYSLELVTDYFGSFGKACLEVNIKTEAMKK